MEDINKKLKKNLTAVVIVLLILVLVALYLGGYAYYYYAPKEEGFQAPRVFQTYSGRGKYNTVFDDRAGDNNPYGGLYKLNKEGMVSSGSNIYYPPTRYNSTEQSINEEITSNEQAESETFANPDARLLGSLRR